MRSRSEYLSTSSDALSPARWSATNSARFSALSTSTASIAGRPRVTEHLAHPVVHCHHEARHGRLHRDDRAVKTPAEIEIHGRRPRTPLVRIEEGPHVEGRFQSFGARIAQFAEHRAGGGVVDAAVAVRFDVHVEMEELVLDDVLGTRTLGRQRRGVDDAIVVGTQIAGEDGPRLADRYIGQLLQRGAHVVRHQIDRRAARRLHIGEALVLEEAGGLEPARQEIVLTLLENVQKPLRALRQAVFKVSAVLQADAEHDDRHLELAQHFRFGIRRQALAQKVRAGEDADVEIGVELVEPDAVLAAIIEVPERDLLRMGGNRAQRPLADQVISRIADIAKLLEKLLLRLGLFLSLRIGDG